MPSIIGSLHEDGKTSILNITFRMERFLPLCGSVGKVFYSPCFSFSETFWCFEVIPNNVEGRLQLRVFRAGLEYDPDIVVAFTLLVERADGYACSRGTEVRKINENLNGIVWFFDLSVLLRQKSLYFPSDAFTVMCQLATSLPLGPTMMTNLNSILASGKYSDLNIRVKNKTFKAHKALLAANSPVFAEMFELEIYKSGFSMHEYEPEVFEVFLQFFYFDLINITESNAFDLYKIACYFAAEPLKTYCRMFFAQNLSADNVCDLAAFAEDLGDTDTMEIALNFFEDNMTFFFTPKWKSFVEEHCRAANKFLKGILFKLRFPEEHGAQYIP